MENGPQPSRQLLVDDSGQRESRVATSATSAASPNSNTAAAVALVPRGSVAPAMATAVNAGNRCGPSNSAKTTGSSTGPTYVGESHPRAGSTSRRVTPEVKALRRQRGLEPGARAQPVHHSRHVRTELPH